QSARCPFPTPSRQIPVFGQCRQMKHFGVTAGVVTERIQCHPSSRKSEGDGEWNTELRIDCRYRRSLALEREEQHPLHFPSAGHDPHDLPARDLFRSQQMFRSLDIGMGPPAGGPWLEAELVDPVSLTQGVQQFAGFVFSADIEAEEPAFPFQGTLEAAETKPSEVGRVNSGRRRERFPYGPDDSRFIMLYFPVAAFLAEYQGPAIRDPARRRHKHARGGGGGTEGPDDR